MLSCSFSPTAVLLTPFRCANENGIAQTARAKSRMNWLPRICALIEKLVRFFMALCFPSEFDACNYGDPKYAKNFGGRVFSVIQVPYLVTACAATPRTKSVESGIA